MPKAAILHTDGSYRLENLCNIEQYQNIVGGYVTIYPHSKGNDADVVAFVNDEALLLQLPTNYAAWGLMTEAFGYKIPYYGVWGTVIVLGRNERSLSKQQLFKIKTYYNNINNNNGSTTTTASSGDKRST